MRYNILYRDGRLVKYNNLGKVRKGLTFEKLLGVGVNSGMTKSEIAFCEKYGVQATIYNIGCLRMFGFVEIPDGMLGYLKNITEVDKK